MDDGVIRSTGGLLAGRPVHVAYPEGRLAARALAADVAGRAGLAAADGDRSQAAEMAALLKTFRESLPRGLVVGTDPTTPPEVAAMSAAEHREILRAALEYGTSLRVESTTSRFEVTAFYSGMGLSRVFIIDRTEDAGARRIWRNTIRAANAAGALRHDDRVGLARLGYALRLSPGRGRVRRPS
jgi:hypothetical protein